ncbi:general substrate transporter [Xylogone sp. PMI_703]|nr:general substrate transporter [Xylogone sp. PMI_703]
MTKSSYLGLRGHRLQRAMLAFIVFPAYNFLGYNNTVMGGLVSNRQFINQFPSLDTITTKGTKRAQNARVEGTVVAIYLVGAMFGALSCLKLGDRLGRIRTILIGAAISIAGWVLESSSFSLAQLIVSRVVVGLGTGAISATVPIWQSECSSARHRGSIVVLEGTFAGTGFILSQWLELGFFFVQDSSAWRFPFALPIVLTLLLLAFAPFMPESPRWLVKQGRVDEARHITSVLEDAPEDSELVATIIEKMQHSLGLMHNASLKDLARNGEDRLLNRAAIAIFSAFAQQMCGVAVLGYYTDTIFEQFAGLSQLKARILSGSVYILLFMCSIITYYTVDYMGRRTLMMIGISGMGVMSAVIAGTTSNTDSQACAIVATVAVFLFMASFGFGMLGVSYLYGAEVAPLAHRVPIYALTSTVLWSFNFLSTEISPVAFATLGSKYFILYAAIDLCVFLPVIYFFFPETQGLLLEDIDIIFRTAKNPLHVVKVARTMNKLTEPNDLERSEETPKREHLHLEELVPASAHE